MAHQAHPFPTLPTRPIPALLHDDAMQVVSPSPCPVAGVCAWCHGCRGAIIPRQAVRQQQQWSWGDVRRNRASKERGAASNGGDARECAGHARSQAHTGAHTPMAQWVAGC